MSFCAISRSFDADARSAWPCFLLMADNEGFAQLVGMKINQETLAE
jgi:hypothetical protein